EDIGNNGTRTRFEGFKVADTEYHTSSFECKSCPNLCEIARLSVDGRVLAQWGGRCDLWERTPTGANTSESRA
ncbi:MAG: 2-hydroxyglutaryl-CoA dehydratase, partial [Dehalococcoidia bacterium]|nr:2-hydroxyglutaryl-CoA dehydratase [Dehalococcoidia bacterium]